MNDATTRLQIPGRLNAMIIVCQLAALGGFLFAASRVQSWRGILLLALGFGILLNSMYAIIHEAEHGILFPDRRWNDAAGSVLALFFPAPFHLIRQGHLGHHMR